MTEPNRHRHASRPIRLRSLCSLILIGLASSSCAMEVGSGDEVSVSQQFVVQGTDDRTLVTRANSTAYPWRTVAAFRPTSGRSTASCSAFKVGPRHLLTAAHCFEGSDGQGNYVVRATVNTVRLVFGQYGSGNAAANMPVDGRKIPLQSVYIPPGWAASGGTDARYDWALMRLSDANSSRGWFNALARNDASIRALTSVFADGFPLNTVTGDSTGTDSPCSASPLASGDCGGYQYQAPATVAGISTSYLETRTDMDRGQSGGVLYAVIPGQSQRAAIGVLAFNSNGLNYAVRITSTIANKICEQVRAHRSTAYPTHECN